MNENNLSTFANPWYHGCMAVIAGPEGFGPSIWLILSELSELYPGLRISARLSKEPGLRVVQVEISQDHPLRDGASEDVASRTLREEIQMSLDDIRAGAGSSRQFA